MLLLASLVTAVFAREQFKCKTHEGCHIWGCDPNPTLSDEVLHRNEFPVICESLAPSHGYLKATQKFLANLVMGNNVEIGILSKEIARLERTVDSLKEENGDIKSALDEYREKLVTFSKALSDSNKRISELENDRKRVSDCEAKKKFTGKRGTTKTKSQIFSEPPAMTSCESITMKTIPIDLRNETGGEVMLNIPGVGNKTGYCDVVTDGGSWTVFQRRMNGIVDFNRDWVDYVKGFGDPRGDFWLGLDAIHSLTKEGSHELRVEMLERNGSLFVAEYSYFRVGSSSHSYVINVTGYSGNATDSLRYHDRMKFQTKDLGKRNCAFNHKGGWWYNGCHNANLNGKYDELVDSSGVTWYDWAGDRFMFMKFVEMKFRRKQ